MGAKSAEIGYKKVHTPLGSVPMYPLRAAKFIPGSGIRVRALTSTPGNKHNSNFQSEVQIMEWPADKIERKKVDDLIPYAKNARTLSEST